MGTVRFPVTDGAGHSTLASVPVTVTAVASNRLRWRPPTLAAGYDVWQVPATGGNLTRGSRTIIDRDLLVVMPNQVVNGTISTLGFRNIVMIGGHVKIPSGNTSQFTLRIDGWAGVAHIEGLLVDANGHIYTGSGIYTDGIRSITPHDGTVLQLENVRVQNVDGLQAGAHGDILQTWSGPVDMRVDRFTGRSSYQGFFMAPLDPARSHNFTSVHPYDFRHVDLAFDRRDGAKLLDVATYSMPDSSVPHAVGSEVYCKRYPGSSKAPFSDYYWSGVAVEGTPPDGEFVPAGAAGLGYVSPGYL